MHNTGIMSNEMNVSESKLGILVLYEIILKYAYLLSTTWNVKCLRRVKTVNI